MKIDLFLNLIARILAIATLTLHLFGSTASALVTIFPKAATEEEEPSSPFYEVFANGRPVPVYISHHFVEGSQERLWGRPVLPSSFCSLDTNEAVTITVRFRQPLLETGIDNTSVIVRPLAENIRPAVVDNSFTFVVRKTPCQLSIEPGGDAGRPLFLFINPPEVNPPPARGGSKISYLEPGEHTLAESIWDKKDVLYFKPGYHLINAIPLKSGSSGKEPHVVYLAGGAVVEVKPLDNPTSFANTIYEKDTYWGATAFNADRKENLVFRGRGILSGRRALEAGQRIEYFSFSGTRNIRIEGLVLRDSGHHAISFINGEKAEIDNVKLFTPYAWGDGVIIGGMKHVTVKNCFAQTSDDGFEIKSWTPTTDIVFDNCVIWSDLGGSFGLFHESDAVSSDITFRNCTVLHSMDNSSACGVIGIKLTGKGSAEDYSFENITIEDVRGSRKPSIKVINNRIPWHLWPESESDPENPYLRKDAAPAETAQGAITNIRFRNINVLQAANPDIAIIADGPDSPISNVTFEKVKISGTPVLPDYPHIFTNQWVSQCGVAE